MLPTIRHRTPRISQTTPAEVSAHAGTASADYVADPPPIDLVTPEGQAIPELNWASSFGNRLAMDYRKTSDLRLPNRHTRRKNAKAVDLVADSITKFGFNNPLGIDDKGVVRCGVVRLLAAIKLKMPMVPVIPLAHLDETRLRLYAIADNKLTEIAGWDEEVLAEEFKELELLSDELEVTGFSSAEIDQFLSLTAGTPKTEDNVPELAELAVAQHGDIFIFEGGHRLICADACAAETYDRLMAGEKARMVVTDPPYGVAIQNNVSGKGKVQHREFVMGAKGTREEELLSLLTASAANMAAVTVDGGIHAIFMDWRHMYEMCLVGQAVYKDRPKQLCVWVKNSAGMGTFYRSQHELCFFFKVGSAPHVNNFGLGGTGRYRTNCWSYDGQSGFHQGRDEELSMHPTVKPVVMIMDAIKDCSKKGEIILDAFGGSGTTLIAAHKTKRRARLIELDPLYVDVIIRRFQKLTGTSVILEGDGRTFDELATARVQGSEVSRG